MDGSRNGAVAFPGAIRASHVVGTGLLPPWYQQLLSDNLEVGAALAGRLLEPYSQWLETANQWLEFNPFYTTWKSSVDRAFDDLDLPSPAGLAYEANKRILDRTLSVYPAPVQLWIKYQMTHNPALQEQMHSSGMIAVMELFGKMLPGVGELHSPEYNHQFLTQEANGTIRVAPIEEIDALFPRTPTEQANGSHFPHVIVTASHARAERLSDVTDITHGIEALARESEGTALDVIHLGQKTAETKNKSLILFACDTEKNPFLNGVQLLRRLEDLEQIAETGEVDRFEKVSPAAKRIAKLILRCMAQNPDDVAVDDPRSLAEIGKTIALRKCPERIAQHFQLIGYSKGGNVVSDAMRYLVGELMAQGADKTPLVTLGNNRTVRDLVRNIACLSIAALEVPMAEHYKKQGVRRDSFNNAHDTISNHMDFESSWSDHKWKIEGIAEHHGHDPKDALGTRDSRGYVLDDTRVRRRMKEAFAPLYGKAVISSISFKDKKLHGDQSVLIGTAAGTPDELLLEHAPTIIKAMVEQGLHDVQLKAERDDTGRAFILSMRENVHHKAPRDKIGLALNKLRTSPTLGLVIADAIVEPLRHGVQAL